MPTLEIITIGTELLLGEITDTNSTYIARTLRDHGIDIYRITTIGDNPGRISAAIKEACHRADIIITTGGLGPTVDDPTRQAVADAVGSQLVFINELWDQIKERFEAYGREPTKNNQRQAFIPEGAIPVANPVGTALCFIIVVESSYIISLPGVPSEMRYVLHHEIIPFLIEKFNLKSQIIKATVLHAASIGESTIDEIIGDLETHTNPTVGLLAHPGQVDIRVTAKASSESEAAQMMGPILADLRQRLGDNIYGQDEDTLENVIHLFLLENHLKLGIINYGFDETLHKRLKHLKSEKCETQLLNNPPGSLELFSNQVLAFQKDHDCDVGFGLAMIINHNISLHLVYRRAGHTEIKTNFYGGHRDNAKLWAQNIGLDFLRRNLIKFIGKRETGET